MDARVIGYNETTKYQSTTPSQKFTVYNVRVKYGGREWEISKRYNDFAKLHEVIQNESKNKFKKQPLIIFFTQYDVF